MSNAKPRVMIVEDSPSMRELIAMVVTSPGDATVAHAADGVAALKSLKAAEKAGQLPHLLFLDINMPMLDGMKLLAMLREDSAFLATTVCVVTTENSRSTEKQARALGAKYFLRKPVHRHDIEKVCQEVLAELRKSAPA